MPVTQTHTRVVRLAPQRAQHVLHVLLGLGEVVNVSDGYGAGSELQLEQGRHWDLRGDGREFESDSGWRGGNLIDIVVSVSFSRAGFGI